MSTHGHQETGASHRPTVRRSDAETRADERTDVAWFRQSWDHAPDAVAVVSGPTHTLVYANRAFGQLGTAGKPAEPGARGRVLVGARHRRAATGPRGGRRGPARRGSSVERSGPVDPPHGPVGAVTPWHCTAWPLAEAPPEAGDATPARADEAQNRGRLVLAIDASPHAECPHARQRELTELVLLSALREDSRADAADVARQGAERESAARARSLAEMSHEIRTPLTAIGGYSDLIAMGLLGPVTDRQREALARIHAAMYHLLGLASAQLERAQLEAGRVNYAMADVAVDEALAGAVALLAPQAAAKGVALTIRPSRPGLTVRADAARLRQVVLNLLGNAIKYTASGGTVSCEAAPIAVVDAGARVAIRVADTGCGIAAADLAHVFDPYVQVSRHLDARLQGVGLGLAISRELAWGMGGDLTAESTPGVGSTFTLTLPRA